MKDKYFIQVQLITERNLGDHGEIVRVAIECNADMTIGELIKNHLVRDEPGFITGEGFRRINKMDVIEIRVGETNKSGKELGKESEEKDGKHIRSHLFRLPQRI